MLQSPSPPLSGGRGFYKEREGNRTEIEEGGCKVLYVQRSTVPSGEASDSSVCVTLGHSSWVQVILTFHHPGSTVEDQQIFRSWYV